MIVIIVLYVCVQLATEKWEDIQAWLNVSSQLGS